ncbi:D-2-hydroxyacid dehydrogenase protein [Rutstroemia sp. NJR-2017a WRK4]|nr:D-2-hydroxyacid dehydrogenase protein [Rutstroemia sp. NJR-2017a WRK4]
MSLESSSTTFEPSPFLRLPPEVRNQIYLHLVPHDALNPQYCLPGGPLRLMRASCSPAILRLNRKIYNEVILLWYGVATYPFFLRRTSEFLGNEYLMDERCVLPACLKLVRSLDIRIYSCMIRSNTRIDSLPAWTTCLANFLADSKCLEHLKIYLYVMVRLEGAITTPEETIHASLEEILSPFRAIRGLSKVTTTFKLGDCTYPAQMMPALVPVTTLRKMADANRWICAYLDEFEAGMLRK